MNRGFRYLGFLRNPQHPKQWFLRIGPFVVSSWPYKVKMQIHTIYMSVEWNVSQTFYTIDSPIKDGFYMWVCYVGNFVFVFCYNKMPYRAPLI